MRQISVHKAARVKNVKLAVTHLERSAWGRGIYMPGRIVPAARPAQIRAGAKKLIDILQSRFYNGAK